MFSGPMVNTWLAATMVGVVAGSVGVIVIMRRSAFVAHAVPHGAFGGAAGATLLGVNVLWGLGLFATAGALTIGRLSRRGRGDVATALTLVLMLGLGALFLSFGSAYAPAVYALLFGEILGVARSQLLPIASLGATCLITTAVLFRPLMLDTVLPDVAEASGMRRGLVQGGFLVVVALATTMTVPVVGAFLMFSLMIGPAGAARLLTARPGRAVAAGVALALATVWVSVAASYWSNWPVGFFVGVGGLVVYLVTQAAVTLTGRSAPGGRTTEASVELASL